MSEFARGGAGVARSIAHAIDPGDGSVVLLRSRGNTIEEGRSEIQRGIIAERLLELSKAIAL
jgi:hypothetical protein